MNRDVHHLKEKKVATPSVWKRNITKEKRAKGEETINLRGNVIKKIVTGVDFKCKSVL